MSETALIRQEFLLDAPGGRRQRELLFGDRFEAESEGDWVRGVAAKDGYAGWLPRAALGVVPAATHRVKALMSHVYPEPDMKVPPVRELALNAAVAVRGEEMGGQGVLWAEISLEDQRLGYVPAAHLGGLRAPGEDFVQIAERFAGVPYLWAGNSARGIDCSGLVQVACHAAGMVCPPDSGDQAAAWGRTLESQEELRRGDLVFWKGHVAIALDGDTILHANAHHMAVAAEPLTAAEARIAAGGGGPVTVRRRVM